MLFIMMAIIGIVEAHISGYAVLIGSTQIEGATAELKVRSCTYFTGSEKVITHISESVRSPATKSRCSLIYKVLTPSTSPSN